MPDEVLSRQNAHIRKEQFSHTLKHGSYFTKHDLLLVFTMPEGGKSYSKQNSIQSSKISNRQKKNSDSTSLETMLVQKYTRPTDRLMGMKYRATSAAKKYQEYKFGQRGARWQRWSAFLILISILQLAQAPVVPLPDATCCIFMLVLIGAKK